MALRHPYRHLVALIGILGDLEVHWRSRGICLSPTRVSRIRQGWDMTACLSEKRKTDKKAYICADVVWSDSFSSSIFMMSTLIRCPSLCNVDKLKHRLEQRGKRGKVTVTYIRIERIPSPALVWLARPSVMASRALTHTFKGMASMAADSIVRTCSNTTSSAARSGEAVAELSQGS